MAEVEVTIIVGLRSGTRHIGTRWTHTRDAGTDPGSWGYEIRAAINAAAQFEPALTLVEEPDGRCGS